MNLAAELGPDKTRLARRIADAVKAAGGRTFVALRAEIPLSSLNKYASGIISPSAVALDKIAAATGKPVAWFTQDSEQHSSSGTLVPNEESDRVVHIPILDVRAAAGAGATDGDEQILAYLPFPREFLRTLGVKPEKVRALHAYGDSMEPTIPDGRLVLVDLGDRDISRPRVFVLRTPDGLRLKRVQRLMDGSLRLLSDNKDLYPAETVSGADIDAIKVIGRAIWTERLL